MEPIMFQLFGHSLRAKLRSGRTHFFPIHFTMMWWRCWCRRINGAWLASELIFGTAPGDVASRPWNFRTNFYEGKTIQTTISRTIWVVQELLGSTVFEMTKNSLIPTEFRLMIVLRFLGRGITADDCNELSDIPQSTCNTIFKTFCRNFNAKASLRVHL